MSDVFITIGMVCLWIVAVILVIILVIAVAGMAVDFFTDEYDSF